MMFQGDVALKKISVLSGGEKSRVMLGKLLATPANMLLLDEPTNHLDMESCDALLAAIDNFEGVVIMVTHNEMFIHALAQRLIVFQNDGIRVFEGSYAEFLEKGGWEDESGDAENSCIKSGVEENNVPPKLTKKELRRMRSEIIAERSKALKPLDQRISRTEDDIDRHEKELDRLNGEMQAASQAQDGTKIAEISQSIHTCQSGIDLLFDELESLTEKSEAHKSVFEERLEALAAKSE